MAGFSFVAILAMGQAFPILVRGIDLSIGAIVGLVGMVVFDLTLIFHLPGYVILPVALVAGIAGRGAERRAGRRPAAATLHRHPGDARRLSRPDLRDLRAPARAGPDHDRRSRDRGSSASRPISTSAAGWASPNVLAMPWFPLSFFIMLALFAVLPVRAAGDALRARSLRRRRQRRGGPARRHQYRARDHRRLRAFRLLRRDRGADHGRAVHDRDRGTRHRHGADRHRRGGHRRRQPRRRHRVDVRPRARRLPARRRAAGHDAAWACRNSCSRSSPGHPARGGRLRPAARCSGASAGLRQTSRRRAEHGRHRP